MVGKHAPTLPKRSAPGNWHIGVMEYGTTKPQYTEKTRRTNAASTHSHDTHIIRCAMSEGAGAEATSSETSGSVTAAPAAASAADPLAAVEAIDELLAANDDHESSKKRNYL